MRWTPDHLRAFDSVCILEAVRKAVFISYLLY